MFLGMRHEIMMATLFSNSSFYKKISCLGSYFIIPKANFKPISSVSV